MPKNELRVEAVPAAPVIQEFPTSRCVDLIFEIHNDSPCALALVAVEQDIYTPGGSLLRRRVVDEDAQIGPGERRRISDPLPEFAHGTPLALLVYTLTFRGQTGGLVEVVVPVAPIEHAAPARPEPLTPLSEIAARTDDRALPMPRQLARAWFETLYQLGVYRRR